MSGNNYDRFEQFFRSRLADENAAEQTDAPPRGVLDNAFQHLDNERKRRRRLIFYILAAGTVVASLSIVLFLTNYQLESLDQKIEQLQTQSEPSAFTIQADQSTASESGLSSDFQPDAENEKSNTVASNENLTNSESTVVLRTDEAGSPGFSSHNAASGVSHNSEKATADAERRHEAGANNVVTLLGTGPTEGNENLTNPKETVDQSSLGNVNINSDNTRSTTELKKLNGIAISPLLFENRVDIASAIPVVSSRLVSKSRISCEFLFGHNLTSIRMTGTEASAYSLTEYDQHYSGFYAGLGLSYALSDKLSLQVLSKYSRLNNESRYLETMPYDKGNEMVDDNGALAYRNQIIMESPIGQFMDDVGFVVEGLDLEQNEPMENETSIHQCFDVVSLTAGLGYEVMEMGRFSMLLGGGLGVNYVAGLEQDMNTKLYVHGMMMMDHSYNVPAERSVKRTYMSVHGNLGLQYAMTDRLYLGLDFAYDRSLTSIRKSSIGDVRTYLDGFQSGLKVGVRF